MSNVSADDTEPSTAGLPDEVSTPDPLPKDLCEALARYEAEFVDRYTAKDPNFQSYLGRECDPPPILENFYSRPAYGDRDRHMQGRQGYNRRYEDGPRQRGDRYGHRSSDHDRQYRDDRRRYDSRGSHQDNYRHDQRRWPQQRPRSGPNTGWT